MINELKLYDRAFIGRNRVWFQRRGRQGTFFQAAGASFEKVRAKENFTTFPILNPLFEIINHES